ncbi:cell division protein FtsL [Defluviimonas sp. WL0002]|uniref:Cell division protein FtsL n=1 Tax=Albidovulum marisflavi TaxID=2984159 RepID=A0ABT2ZCV7_9RHOB|nr:cell division protein FtsL [Defluviimonas sp. WL0002]MCV2868980.1 cell division protein FtsL [Defluviimonas sp. WL0002]
MRSLLYVLTAFAVMGLAFWAYRENYRTQAELAEARKLQSEIADLRERVGVLKAEWAYLNRPDRLRVLADINFARLGLLPMEPRQFGDVREVSYPGLSLLPVSEAVDAIAITGGSE